MTDTVHPKGTVQDVIAAFEQAGADMSDADLLALIGKVMGPKHVGNRRRAQTLMKMVRRVEDPLSFSVNERRGPPPDFTGYLTPDIARSWLTEGVPPCSTLVRRYDLRKWSRGVDPLTFGAFRARDAFIQEIGFGIPCKEAIEAVVQGGPAIEVGCGTGFWTALVRHHGGDIIASDTPAPASHAFRRGKFSTYEKADAEEFVRAHPNRNVLMVWPTYADNWAARGAKAMQPDRTLFLVSEGYGGCVADDDLFQHLEKEFRTTAFCSVPVWPTIGDRMTIHRKGA
jgi:hypothetical protein